MIPYLQAPPSAGMIVVTAQRGGLFRETIAMAKTYAEARQQHGKSELLDDIVAAKPERDHTHYHSPEELRQHGLEHFRDSVALLETKATPEEVDEYRRFIVTLSQKVAAAHREHGQQVSESEQTAIDDISEALTRPPGKKLSGALHWIQAETSAHPSTTLLRGSRSRVWGV